MENRRSFIRKLGLSTIGTVLMTDPFMQVIAKAVNTSLHKFVQQFSHTCEIIRPDDFLYLKYYFVNLKLNSSALTKIDDEKEAYIIVRIAQQHVGEEVQKSINRSDPNVDWSFNNDCKIKFPNALKDNFSKSFISGFSYFTFKLNDNQISIPYNQKSLTSWNQFNLLTIEDLKTYPTNIPVNLLLNNKAYPISESNFPIELAVAEIEGIIIPITIIEAPYKIYLSPIAPYLRPEKGTDYRYQFSRSNIIIEYYSNNGSKSKYKLTELWSNDLIFQITHPSKGVAQLPPNFKVVGYEENSNRLDLDNTVTLIPSPKDFDRSNLGHLTNLQEFNRDVSSKYFNFSSLGVSAFIEYFNLDEKQYGIVGWKQDIKLGRDNYVEITKKAIDSRSTLKLLLSEIAERRIEKGKSVLIYRQYFKYLEKEKEFNEPLRFNNYLFKKIIALAEGFYFEPDSTFGDAKNYFIPNNECTKQIIKMPYRGIDINGNAIDFLMDLMIIRKFEKDPAVPNTIYFNKVNVINALTKINQRINTNKSQHEIILDSVKINYAPKEINADTDPANNLNNTELITQEMQFYSVFNEDFEQKYPLIPNLKFSKVKLPQLEGIETKQEFYPVCFSTSYNNFGMAEANKTKVFVQTIKDPYSYLPVVESNINLIVNKQKEISDSIKNIFSDNYKNAGSLINPDIVIDNISTLKQGISLTDELNSRVSDISNIRPADVLRGINVEILGGIDLKKILKNIIPLADSPLFEIIDEAKEGFEKIAEYAKEYQDIKKQVENIPLEIKALESQLKNIFNSELKSYVDKYFSAKEKLSSLESKLNIDLTIDLPVPSQKKIYGVLKENKINFESELNAKISGASSSLPEAIAVMNEIKDFFTTNIDDLNTVISLKQIADLVQKTIESQNQNRLKNTGLILDRRTYSSSIIKLSELALLNSKIKEQILTKNIISSAKERLKISFSNKLKKETLKIFSDKFPGIFTNITKEFFDLYLLKELSVKKLVQIDSDIYKLLKTYENDLGLTSQLLIDIPTGKTLYKLNDNIDGIIEFLNENASSFIETSDAYYKIFINSFNDVINTSEKFIESERTKINKEITLLHNQISYEVKREVDQIWDTVILKSQAYRNIKETYYFFQSVYLEFLNIQKQAEEIENQLNINLALFKNYYRSLLPLLDKAVKRSLKEQLQAILSDPQLDSQIKNEINELHSKVDQLIFENTNEYILVFANLEGQLIEQTSQLYLRVDNERQKVLTEIEAKKKQLKSFEDQLKNFINYKIQEVENSLKDANKELIDAYQQSEEAVARVQNRIQAYKEKLNQIRSVNKKEIRYTWKTNNFNDIDLGILKFTAGKQTPTELIVDIKNTIHFDISSFPPHISGISNETKSVLSNFSVNFLSILNVEFENVSFVGGSAVEEKFDVAIRDIRFSGPLNFVEVFQSFLKTIDKGLRFDISAAGAILGYEVCLPDITGGAFNFVNWKLVMDLRLPFKAGIPMQVNFGLNTPQEMGLVTGAIWGGRGCLVIGVEPKRGVVYILLIIEVGVVLYLNIGVAEGIVYIFAGIYIKKENDKVELKGYLTCGGALNILGLITASVTFYMGLQGNGNFLEGYCTISYEIKICAFVKISVSMSMYKRIYGSPDNSQRNDINNGSARSGLMEKYFSDPGIESNKNMDIEANEINISDSEWNDFFAAYYN